MRQPKVETKMLVIHEVASGTTRTSWAATQATFSHAFPDRVEENHGPILDFPKEP